ncbi:MAG: hypothetical protein ACLQGV_08755 [Bryobacteraceae bacterium]
MDNDKQLSDWLAQIHKQLVNMTAHLETLARVARAEHPDVFKIAQTPATVRRDPGTLERS